MKQYSTLCSTHANPCAVAGPCIPALVHLTIATAPDEAGVKHLKLYVPGDVLLNRTPVSQRRWLDRSTNAYQFAYLRRTELVSSLNMETAKTLRGARVPRKGRVQRGAVSVRVRVLVHFRRGSVKK